MTIKRYAVELEPHGFQVLVEVDHSILTEERALEINSFWGGADERISEMDGDVVMAIIRVFADQAIMLSLENGGDFLKGESDEYLLDSLNKKIRNLEGWHYPSENQRYGWCGVRVISIDTLIDGDLTIKLVDQEASLIGEVSL